MTIRHFNILVATTFLSILCAVRGAEDDDIIGEIIIDLAVGVGMSICEQYVLCRAVLIITTGIVLSITLILLCTGEIPIEEICNRRTTRRGFTTGIGYALGRSFR